MADIIGRQIEVGVSTEYTRKTGKTTVEKWVKKITGTFLKKKDTKVDESAYNRLEGAPNERIVKTWIEGSIEGNVHADAIGYFFYNLYGADTESAAGTGGYKHTFSLSQSIQHATLSFFAKYGAIVQEMYNGCMVQDLEISAKPDDFVKFKASILGINNAANSATPAYDTEYDFVGRDVSVKVATTEAGLAGATALKLNEATIKWANNLAEKQVLGAYTNDDIENTELAIEGSISGYFDGTTLKGYEEANTPIYMKIVIEGEAVIAVNQKPTITLILNKVLLKNRGISGGANEKILETFDFKAYYNTADTEASTLELINLTAEYDTPTSV